MDGKIYFFFGCFWFFFFRSCFVVLIWSRWSGSGLLGWCCCVICVCGSNLSRSRRWGYRMLLWSFLSLVRLLVLLYFLWLYLVVWVLLLLLVIWFRLLFLFCCYYLLWVYLVVERLVGMSIWWMYIIYLGLSSGYVVIIDFIEEVWCYFRIDMIVYEVYWIWWVVGLVIFRNRWWDVGVVVYLWCVLFYLFGWVWWGFSFYSLRWSVWEGLVIGFSGNRLVWVIRIGIWIIFLRYFVYIVLFLLSYY